MKIIGVTGPSGSGKSMLCQRLFEHGICVINADKVYHSLLVPPSDCLNSIRSAFGDKVFLADGRLDRSALGQIVFNNEEKLSLLNSTVLGFVLDKIKKEIKGLQQGGVSIVCIDAPTLIESGFDKECDLVISVLCHKDIRIRRIMERDGLDEAAATLRTQAQRDDNFYIASSDIVLHSDSENYENELSMLINKLI